MSALDLSLFPSKAPTAPSRGLQYVDVGVTPTAPEFNGTYRGKQYHPADIDSVLDRAGQASVEKILLTGMKITDLGFHNGICLAREEIKKKATPRCYFTAGVHPYHADELATEPERTKNLNILAGKIDEDLQRDYGHIKAFGEIGLDFDRTNHASKEDQIVAFRAQLDLFVSKAWPLPLFLHCRNAFDAFVEILQPYIPQLKRGGLVHSFVGSTHELQTLLAMGLDISINGFSFKTASSLEMVAAVPLERLHLETDAPWGEIKPTFELAVRYCEHAPGAPASKKRDKWDKQCMVKERNESCMISRVAFIVAGLKGLDVGEVADAAWENSNKLFDLEQ